MWRQEKRLELCCHSQEESGAHRNWKRQESIPFRGGSASIFCLTTSNLPWFMDLTFQVPMQLSFTASDFISTTGHCFHFGSVSSFFLELLLFSSSILGTYWPGEFIFQCHIFLPFHTVHRVLKARVLKWFAIPFSSGPHCQNSPPWPIHLGFFCSNSVENAISNLIEISLNL